MSGNAIDPADPDIIFAGTRPAALYRSTDGGRNWRKLPAEIVEECPNVGAPRVTALTIDPSDHRVCGPASRWMACAAAPMAARAGAASRTGSTTSTSTISRSVNGSTKVLTSTPGEIFASSDRGESWQGLGVRDQFSLRYCRGLAQKADDPETRVCRDRRRGRSAPPARSSARATAARVGSRRNCRSSRTRRSGRLRRTKPIPA